MPRLMMAFTPSRMVRSKVRPKKDVASSLIRAFSWDLLGEVKDQAFESALLNSFRRYCFATRIRVFAVPSGMCS
jgi:hypothetical protein